MSGRREDNHWEVWGIAIVVSVAVIAGLFFKGFTGETVSDSVKDLGGALIPIIAAFVAAKLVTREMDPEDRFGHEGEEALRVVQKAHSGYLSGPKADKGEKYDPDNPGGKGRYLFIQKPGQGRRAQLTPVRPLRNGVVEIHVGGRAMQILGFAGKDKDPHAVKLEYQKKVRDKVLETLESKYKGLFEVLFDGTGENESRKNNIALAFDFDEASMGPKAFRKAVVLCIEAALSALLP